MNGAPPGDPEPCSGGGPDHSARLAAGLTAFSLRRPVTVLVLLMSIIVVGLVATLGIPVELFPRGFTSQNIMVGVPWQNAPTQEVLDKITIPLEEELSTVKGLERITSMSSVGFSRVVVSFKQGTDLDIAYREIRDRTQRARVLFPEDVDRVFIRKPDASGIPVSVIGFAMDPTLTDSYSLIKNEVIRPLERIDGVASVVADGLEEKEIIIELDRTKIEAHGIRLHELLQKLAGENFTMPSGNVRQADRKWMLRSIASVRSLEQLEELPLTASLRLRDIARIKYEEPEKRYSVRVNSRPAVAAVIFKEGEANTVQVSQRIREHFEKLKENPRLSSVYIEMLFNQGEVIQGSLGNLAKGGWMGSCLAAVILFFFLRRFRLTLIITLSIPLSLLIALTVMFFAGETLNILTILALVIAVGMLVDNSIVVAENIHRHYQQNLPPREACIKGAGEIALAITMATLTTIVVFVPVALVEGEGQFFLMRLALPVSVSLLASLLIALVFIPLSVYLTLPRNGSVQRSSLLNRLHEQLNRLLRKGYELTFEKLNQLYSRLLSFFLQRRLDLVLILAALFLATYTIPFKKVERVEQQEEDKSGFQMSFQFSNEYSFEDIAAYFQQVERLLKEKTEEYHLRGYFVHYRRSWGRIEGWFHRGSSAPYTAKEVADRFSKVIPEKPGVKVQFGRNNQDEENKSRERFMFRLEGDDALVLDQVAEELERVVVQTSGVLGIRTGEEPSPSELALVMDRERAAQSSMPPEMIAGAIGTALRGSSLPKMNLEGREIPVRVRFQQVNRESLSQLGGLQLSAADGEMVPLGALIKPKVLNSPKQIHRWNKRISRTLTVELEKNEANLARERLMQLQKTYALPEGVSFGQSSVVTMDEEVASMLFAARLSIIFIYLLMGFLFESFILPLCIIVTIPLAAVGVFWFHFLLGKDLDFLGIVGAVLLIGVVVNNGIVLIDYVNRLRQSGIPRSEALRLAALRRFRPIVMTALTTIIGMVPLTFSKPNEIGLSYKSFGITLIGGMSTATVLTLLVVPVFYTFFDDARVALIRAVRLGFVLKIFPTPKRVIPLATDSSHLPSK